MGKLCLLQVKDNEKLREKNKNNETFSSQNILANHSTQK